MKSLCWKKLEFPLPLRVPAQYPWKFWRRQYSIGSFIEWSKLKTLSRTKLKSQHLCRLSIFVVVVGVMVVVVIDFVGLEWLTVKVGGAAEEQLLHSQFCSTCKYIHPDICKRCSMSLFFKDIRLKKTSPKTTKISLTFVSHLLTVKSKWAQRRQRLLKRDLCDPHLRGFLMIFSNQNFMRVGHEMF